MSSATDVPEHALGAERAIAVGASRQHSKRNLPVIGAGRKMSEQANPRETVILVHGTWASPVALTGRFYFNRAVPP